MNARLRLRRLFRAQAGRCAGCGRPMRFKTPPGEDLTVTFDHVVPKSAGGTAAYVNGLAKHARCNLRRGSAPPTGCDRIWQEVVGLRLTARGRLGVRSAVKPHPW